MTQAKRKPGPNPVEHTCLLLNTTRREYEEFERWAEGSGMKKIDLFRRMMSRERDRRSQATMEA